MSRLISRDPVVPIPGYSFVTIQLDDQDNIADTRVAFPAMPDISRLSLGLPFTALPALIARVSGISSISHLLASALACEAIMNVSIPETAHRLRELAACASILQSHALGFHSLSSSDLLVGIEGVPSYRAVSDLFEAFPVLARDAVYLRQFGQRVITMLTGGHTPSEWLVAGGVTAPITEETRLEIVTGLGKACGAVRRGLDAFKHLRDQVIEDIGHFGCFP